MDERPRIKFTYTPDGKRQVEVLGVKGPSCEASLDQIASVIGSVGERSHKDDYYDDGQKVRETQSELS